MTVSASSHSLSKTVGGIQVMDFATARQKVVLHSDNAMAVAVLQASWGRDPFI